MQASPGTIAADLKNATQSMTKDTGKAATSPQAKFIYLLAGVPIVVWLGGTALGPLVNLSLVAVLFGIFIHDVTKG